MRLNGISFNVNVSQYYMPIILSSLTELLALKSPIQKIIIKPNGAYDTEKSTK